MTFAGGYYYQPSYRRETREERQRYLREQRIINACKSVCITVAGTLVASALLAFAFTVM